MEDTTSLVAFAMFIAFSILLLYITYEPIKRWAWSNVKQNKKTHGNGSFKKKQVVISISRKVGK
ncbi:phage protein [Bacillus anthracis]|nr:phage protein [Bacillus anthracis]KOS25848.1 phage protein [Bacillus anthracis]